MKSAPVPGHSLAAIVSQAADDGDLPGLRMMLRDMVGLAQAGTLAERIELDQRLRQNAGTSLSDLLSRQFAQVERLRKRGRLTNEQQYYLVREHVEFLQHDLDHAAELPALEALLREYEDRASKRLIQRRRDEAI